MSPTSVAILAAAAVFAGGLTGLNLHRVLPKHHLTRETQDVVRLGTGTVSILASLVFGLLISTAKGTSDAAGAEMRAYAADVIVLDNLLRTYGAEAEGARAVLRRSTTRLVQDLWPRAAATAAGPGDERAGALLDRLHAAIHALSPGEAGQRRIQDQAIQTTLSLLHRRSRLIEEAEPTVKPLILAVVVSWTVAIFVSFGLNAPRNGTVLGAFLACSLAIGGAVFLILELDEPFAGVLRVSARPMLGALARIGP